MQHFYAVHSDDFAELLNEAQRGELAYDWVDELPRAHAMARGG